ncbi:sensor histidine kinase, partial [Vibrio sp. FNV 38]|nr:sensor histidine kinase [Vibrio sp. FNV 38]
GVVIIDETLQCNFVNDGFINNVGRENFDTLILPQLVNSLLGVSENKVTVGEHYQIDIDTESGIRCFDCNFDIIDFSNPSSECFFSSQSEKSTIINITERTKERKLHEVQRVDALKLAVNQSKHVHSIQEVLMGTIHKFQAPLNMIDSATRILESRNHKCSGLKMMQGAIDEGFQALKYIQAHIPERQHEPLQSTNINQVVHDACAICSSSMLKSYIHLELHLDAQLHSINAKPSRLVLALVQLLDNAIDEINASHATQRDIYVATYQLDDSYCISVEDSGNGIQSEYMNKVFEPFYSSRSTLQERESNGCKGVGLSIVQQVLNDHEGITDISRSSKLGGSKIVISIPTDNREANV